LLAVKWMQKLGYQVYPVFFQTPYLPADKARYSAEQNGIELIVKDVTIEHLHMLKNPRYGFGKNINPCIDCHALMFKMAGEMLPTLGADFLISGEVLGQRPMSQRRDALNAVSKTSGFRELMIRPLSQKLLDDTLPIQQGWVNKEEMLDICGRSRSPQKALVKDLGISYYPQPGGGCLLTDKNYTIRIKDLLSYDETDIYNIQLLTLGRHYRLATGYKLIIGRDERENAALEKQYQNGLILHTQEQQGPLGILLGNEPSTEILRLAASIYLSYCNKSPDEWYVQYGSKFLLDHRVKVKKAEPATVMEYMITLGKENL